MKIARFEVSCPDDNVVVVDGYGPDDRWAAGMTVHFVRDHEGAVRVPRQVSLRATETLTAKLLVDFPWDQWLALAEAFMAGGEQQAERAGSTGAGSTPTGGRNGSGSHSMRSRKPGQISSSEHYRNIAIRHRELTGAGETHQSAVIAREWLVSRRTAEGWVRRCRELGLIAGDD